MKGRALVAGLAAVALGLALLAGCSRPGGGPSSAAKGSLQPVWLPDLSRMSEPVQQQIREAYASLMRKIENPGSTTAELADAYGEMGKLFMAADHYDAAEVCHINAHALAPSDVRWPYYLAQVYRSKSDPVKAAVFFDRTLQLRPADLPALVYLGDSYFNQGRPEAAEPPLRKALSLDSRLAIALVGLGRAALAREDYAAAVQHLEKALALDPQASTIRYPLAMAYRGLGERETAETHLRQRGDVRTGFLPDPLMHELEGLLVSAQAYEFRGTEALDKGEWATAAGYLAKGVALEPDNSPLRLKLGESLRRSGQPEQSLPHYEHAFTVDPGLGGARFGYAMALVLLRRYEEARARLIEGMRLHPDSSAFPQALARLLASAPDDRVRDGRRALSMVHELLKSEQSTDVGETMAMALAEVGQFKEAIELQRVLINTTKRAGRDDLVRTMTDNLTLYEAGKPSRRPWTDDAVP